MAEEVEEILSHWYHQIDGMQGSSKAFYMAVEQAVERRKIPDIRVSRVDHREGGILSAKREYLRVRRKELIFDICSAPFGTGFFVSWWLGRMPESLWAQIPVIGWFWRHFLKPMTYYRMDTALMFQESIRLAVLEILDGATEAKGLRCMSELERRPILVGLFARGGIGKG
jgi:hypothetical protein